MSHTLAYTLGVFNILFAEEPVKEYTDFEIDVRMIRAVAVDAGSARKTIPNVAKTFSFVGDGTAAEVSKHRDILRTLFLGR